jgi:glycosyltransferase involved in cell wall biosynthesis
MPTLLESYGLTYVEALYCGRPILTSDREFARWMCRDLAIYFEPTDPRSVVSAIERLMTSPPDPTFGSRARTRLGELPASWLDVARRFWSVCESAQHSPAGRQPLADTIRRIDQ